MALSNGGVHVCDRRHTDHATVTGVTIGRLIAFSDDAQYGANINNGQSHLALCDIAAIIIIIIIFYLNKQ